VYVGSRGSTKFPVARDTEYSELTPASRRGVAADQSRGVVDPAPSALSSTPYAVEGSRINDRTWSWRRRAWSLRDRSCSHVSYETSSP